MSVKPPGSPFKAVEQRRAFEQILFQIEEAILAGNLRAGDKLPAERELAETFGVSRASVREALRVLEVFGVVIARAGNSPHSGLTIADEASSGLTNALRLNAAVMQIPTHDVVDVRAVLESHSARLAARNCSAEAIAAMRAIVNAMDTAENPTTFHELDTEFHVSLARASRNELIPVLMESLRGSMHRDMLEGFSRLDGWLPARKRLIEQHRTILQCVEANDPEGAAGALDSHIRGFYEFDVDPAARPVRKSRAR